MSIECRGGWYGVNCSQQCSGYCKDKATCNHMTGQCDRGCDAGWTGATCEQGIFSLLILCCAGNYNAYDHTSFNYFISVFAKWKSYVLAHPSRKLR